MKLIGTLWLCVLLALCVGAAPRDDARLDLLKKYAPSADYTIEEGGWLLARMNFTGCAPWALQVIDKNSTKGPGDRSKSSWHRDPDGLPERHARDVDYDKAKGLDKHPLSRGHISPAQFHKRSQREMDSCHNLRNAVMQPQRFNAGSWLKVEDRAIELAEDCDFVLALTLVVFKPQIDISRDEGTRIKRLLVDIYSEDELYQPGYLAKCYACFKDGECVKMESYLAANSDSVATWEISSFLVPVNDLERMTALPIWGTDYESMEKTK